MVKLIKIIVLLVLVLLLVLIRYYEAVLFYDPFLTFFKNDYLYLDSPNPEFFKLIGFTTLRYLLNTIISLAIFWVIFKDKNIITFASIIYGFVFVILISLYSYFVKHPKQEDYYVFFNIRRFLIQPIMLILLLPAFYYHKLKQ